MARRQISLLALAILAVSCGVSGEYGSVQRFQDGIYYKGFDKDMQKVEPLTEEDFQRLAAEQIKKEQQGRRDTLVVIADDPYGWGWSWNWYHPYYTWYGGWHHGWYSGWYSGWGGWYDPWYGPYYSWYGPYYSWYSPWYYGGWYDPWYGPYYYGHHHYYGGGYYNENYYHYRGDSRSDVKGGNHTGSGGMGSYGRSGVNAYGGSRGGARRHGRRQLPGSAVHAA